MIDEQPQCRNCGSPLSDEYCASCGQREGRGDLHFGDFFADTFGEIFTWDSRVWRTLYPLLFKPGFLSAEFIAGRRARYMPPFRVYIVISFLMFLVMSFSAGDRLFVGDLDAASETSSVSIGLDPNSVSEERTYRLGSNTESTDRDVQVRDPTGGDPGEELDADEDDALDLGISLADDAPAWKRSLAERLKTNVRRVSDDSSSYMEQLLNYLPQTMFLMLPLFALLLKLVYLLKPFHYLQHLVFALHYHSFAYLLYMASVVIEKVGLVFDALYILPLGSYLLIALRRTYGSTWGGATIKAMALCFIYGLALVTGLSAAAITVLVTM
ncbi:MAG: DUF3667 domain-containing protein [Congregibacter sp.]